MEKELRYMIYTDLYRVNGLSGLKNVLKALFDVRSNSGFKYLFVMRRCNILFNKKRNIIEKVLLKTATVRLRKMQIKYGIEIPYSAKIGEGLFLPHNGGIVIHPNVQIGKNCTILQGVTIGNNLFKSRNNVAVIGDNVTISAGAKIVGPITIGDNVMIGANAVVTKDIESDSIVAGIPAKVISKRESILLNSDYLSREDYFKN